MDPKTVKKTQDTLGKAIKKPPLTEKLLNKPPFRFLHDIITEVIKNTGALRGLYSDSEMNSANVTEKESKMTFLQKAIDCVGFALGEALTARPSKIVAGHEPEKTNEFLQALGKTCLKKIDTTDSVKEVLAGEKPLAKKKSSSASKERQDDGKGSKEKISKEKPKDNEVIDEKRSKEKIKEKDITEKSDDKKEDRKDKERRRDKSKEDKQKSEQSKDSAAKEKERKPKESSSSNKNKDEKSKDERKVGKGSSKEREGSSKERDGSSKVREGSSKEREKNRKGKERRPSRSADKDKSDKAKEEKESERLKKERSDKDRSKEKTKERKEKSATEKTLDLKSDDDEDQNNNENESEDGQGSARSIQRPASAKGQRSRPTNPESASDDDLPDQDKENGVLQTSESASAVPSQSNKDEGKKQSAVRRLARPSSARPAPPRVKKTEQVEEQQNRVSSGKPVAPVIIDKKKNQDDDDEDDTFIVEEDPSLQNLLEVKSSESNPDFINTAEHGSLVRKMLESKKEADAQQKSNQNEDKPVIFDAARKKEREMAEKEIEKLRGSIQHLVRSAHPLGKIMDYIQEDIDSMQKELSVWKEENKQHEVALRAEQSITESEIEPLQAHLAELEQEITEMMDNISTVKSNILRNEEKIEQLVVGISR